MRYAWFAANGVLVTSTKPKPSPSPGDRSCFHFLKMSYVMWAKHIYGDLTGKKVEK